MDTDTELNPSQQRNFERDLTIEALISGQMRAIYSEWLLDGEMGRPFNPVAVVAVFPEEDGTVVRAVALQNVEEFREKGDWVEDYKGIAKDLELPDLLQRKEFHNYVQYQLQGGIRAFGGVIRDGLISEVLIPNNWPIGMFVFSEDPHEPERRDIYLFSPTVVPPSLALESCNQALES